MLKISCVALAALLVLGGCKEEPRAAQQSAPAAPPIEVTTNSPDATVKTWWRIGDAGQKETVAHCASVATHPLSALRNSISTGDIAKAWAERSCDSEVYDRDIRKVTIESETRAIVDVVIRTVTPLKPGIVLNADAAQRRADGDMYRYLLERTGASAPWKMSQIYMDWSRFDQANPWRPTFK